MRHRLFLLCRAFVVMILFGNLSHTGLGQECPVSSISTMVRILDKQSQPLVNVTADQLKAEINGRPVTINSISPTVKPTVILLVDASSSMKGTWNQSIAAAKQLVGRAGEDVDTFVFRDKIHGFAIGRSESEHLLDRLSTQTLLTGGTSGTSLYDSLVEMASRVKTRNAAIVVISDGEDNASTRTLAATVSLFLRSSWPPVFGLILDYDHAEKRRAHFNEIPAATGGFATYPLSESKVQSATEELATVVLSPFSLSLQPAQPITKTAKLKLEVIAPGGKRRKDVKLLHVAEIGGCQSQESIHH